MNYFIFKNKLFSIAVVFVIGILCLACTRKSTPPKSDSSHTSTKSSASAADTSKEKSPNAPDFTLKDRKGKDFTLSDHKGQIIVLNFWATWCPPCRQEIPGFVKIQKKLRDKGILFVGVSLDKITRNQKGWKAVRSFAKQYGINYPIVLDDGSVAREYGPFRGIPTTFIINKKGKVKYAVTGMINGDALQSVLEKMAKQ
jgi:cytochrome c biogenesis protein CcmG/thiol:disulfide interchange protein DsbE